MAPTLPLKSRAFWDAPLAVRLILRLQRSPAIGLCKIAHLIEIVVEGRSLRSPLRALSGLVARVGCWPTTSLAARTVTGLGIGAHDDVETYLDYYIAGQRLVCLIRETVLLHFPPVLQLLPVPDAWGPAIVAHS
jgi:hypothetical protein